MIKQVTTLSIALAASLGLASAQAQTTKKDDWYAEAGYLGMKLSEDGVGSAKPKMTRFVVGTNLNDNLAVEGMAGLTMSNGSLALSPSISADIKATTYGVLVKPKVALAPGFEAFVRAGLMHTSVKETVGVFSGSDSTTKLTYGLGIQVDFNKNVYGQLDYMTYGKNNDWSASGWTASVGLRY